MINKITVLLHPEDPYPNLKSHLIWYLVDCWKEMGLEIEILKDLPSRQRKFDLLLPHIDLTKTPPEFVKLIDRNPHVLNRKITDISKRRISRNLISKKTAFDGPVIVKTNANYGGIPESQLRKKKETLSDRMQRLLWPKLIRSMNPHKYPVYDTKAEVPVIVWRNPNLVVERFIPERKGDLYCIRVCFFLGDIILNNRVFSRSKVIKGNTIESFEPDEVHQDLIRIREEIGLDYGKFDYVIHDGKVSILDVSKTPGVVSSVELNSRIAQKLAKGINQYLCTDS